MQFLEQANLGKHGHHRMRERVVQVARNLQALADHRSVARLFREPLDFAGARGDTLFEFCAERAQFATLKLQGIQHVRKSGTHPRDLVDTGGHLDMLRLTTAYVLNGPGQICQAPGQTARDQHAEQRDATAQSQRDP